ncbi:MAG: outer membrane protein assembly factor BamB [Granulosicoccus sp.]|nr:outer membrane protein assembly factor BamB [Granulosicoccus sp.]
MRLVISRVMCLIIASLAIACSTEPPPQPPEQLTSHAGTVNLTRVWSARVGESGDGLFEPFVDVDQVVVANRRGWITSLSRATGKKLWTRDLGVRINSGIGGSTDQFYVADTDATVHALDAGNGEPLWQVSASSEVLMPVVAGFGMAVMRSTDGRIVALEPDDGSERWIVSNEPPALTLHGYSRPYLLDGGVLVGLDDGRILALNAATGKLIWESVLSVPSGRSEVERLVDIDADLVVDDEGIYVANYQGRAARLEPAKGQLVWSVPVSAGAGIALHEKSGLAVVDENDTVQLLDKQTGQVLWRNESMTGRRLSPPAFSGQGDVLVGDLEGYVHILGAEDGNAVGRIRPSNDPVKARPLRVDDMVYIQATDGLVAAYRFPD